MISVSPRDARTAWHARWVLPICSPPMENAAVVIEGSRIVEVVASEHAQAGNHEYLGNAVLMPGLINAHSHLELTVLRGALAGLDFRDWLRRLTFVRSNLLSDEDLQHSARLGVSEALLGGITSLADCSASAAPVAKAMSESGVRGRVYLETFGPDPAQLQDSIARLAAGVEALQIYADSLLEIGVSPHAPYTVSEELFGSVGEFAQANELKVAVHVAESKSEMEFVRFGAGVFADGLRARGIGVAASGRSPVQLLRDSGLLEVAPLCIHAIQVSESDIQLLQQYGAPVVHCPLSNARLGHGIAPVREMLGAGLVVALGSDSVISNDSMDLIMEARQAVLQQSLLCGAPDILSPSEVLAMATSGGARALGLADCGELRAGAFADLCAFSLDSLSVEPIYDPCAALVHSLACGRSALLTMVSGRVLVREGKELRADPLIRDSVVSSSQRISDYLKAPDSVTNVQASV